MSLPGRPLWMRNGSSPPTITSLNYTVGDTLGNGNSIIITGTSMATVTAVTFGGTSATITAQTSTTVTVTLPAHTAGVVDVVVTNPGGATTSTSAFEYWNPGTESSCTFFAEKPDYDPAGAAGDGLWTARKGSNIQSGGCNTPNGSSGAVAFNGTAIVGLRTGNISTIINTAGTQEGSIFTVISPNTAGSANSGSPQLEQGIWANETQGAVGLGYSTAGARGFASDGAYKQVAMSLATGAKHTAMMRFKSGVDVNVNVDGVWGTAATLGTTAITGTNISQLGTNYNAGTSLDATMYAFASFNVKITDAVATKAHVWAQQRHTSA